MFTIVRYSANNRAAWNAFVRKAKNATFLHLRGYMDYHRDRFADHSLLFFRNGELYALLPANEQAGTLFSHQGLTYGGLLMGNSCTAAAISQLFSDLNDYLRQHEIHHVVYRPTPWIYHKLPAEEDLYGLFAACNARLSTREISSAIALQQPLPWKRDRKYGVNKARNNGVSVEQSDDYEAFWPILTSNLQQCHGVNPVHSLQEMRLLQSRFPNEIKLYVARNANGIICGGTVLYVTPRTVHAQYISANSEGKRLRVVDALYNRILRNDFCRWQYFDFGKSTEHEGRYLNENLIYQKEGFGARAVCYDTYEWDIF